MSLKSAKVRLTIVLAVSDEPNTSNQQCVTHKHCYTHLYRCFVVGNCALIRRSVLPRLSFSLCVNDNDNGDDGDDLAAAAACARCQDSPIRCMTHI